MDRKSILLKSELIDPEQTLLPQGFIKIIDVR